MSEFYATIQGNRNAKTCGGSKTSGIKAVAQSWEGSVTLFQRDGKTFCVIEAEKRSTSCPGDHLIYSGSLEELFTHKAMPAIHEYPKQEAI